MKCISQTIRRRHNWLCREMKRRCLVDKEEYIKTICQEVQNAHYQNKSRLVYQGVRRITGHDVPRVRAVKDKNGVMLTESKLVKERWKEHLEQLYNPPSTVDRTILDELDASDQTHIDDAAPLLKSEVELAIKRMKMGKAPG